MNSKVIISVMAVLSSVGGAYGQNGDNRTRQSSADSPAQKLMVNGQPAAPDVDPQMVKGRMMVPIRFVGQELGANVSWNAETRTVRLLQGSDDITMTIGSTRARVNGQPRALEVAPIIRDGRTMLPLREVGRFTGGIVTYNASTRTVFVTTPGGRGGGLGNTAKGSP